MQVSVRNSTTLWNAGQCMITEYLSKMAARILHPSFTEYKSTILFVLLHEESEEHQRNLGELLKGSMTLVRSHKASLVREDPRLSDLDPTFEKRRTILKTQSP